MGATHDCVAYGYPRNAYVNQRFQRYTHYPIYGCHPNYANQYQLSPGCANRAIKNDGPSGIFRPNSAISTYSSQSMQNTSIHGCIGSLSPHPFNNSAGATSFQSDVAATSGIYPSPRAPFESFNVPPPPLPYRDWTPPTFI